MIDFICIGLDIKKAGSGEPYSADANVWEQETELYRRAKVELSIDENALQLLHPKNQIETDFLFKMVEDSDNAVLISFELPTRIFESYPYRDLMPPIQAYISGQMWQTLGLDICDIDGFFSFLDMTYSSDKSTILFDEDHLVEALILAQAANLEVPRHAPFVVIRLKMHACAPKAGDRRF